jgi:hypothetical protein
MRSTVARRFAYLSIALAAVQTRPARAQEKPAFAQRPSASADDQLGDWAQRLQNSVLIVGDDRVGLGTAWVLSKEHRLLATNAHVADLFFKNDNELRAVCNGQSHQFEVERAWWHPGVIRQLEGAVFVHSDTPADGEVLPFSPDVAVLQLKESERELPEPFPMATPEEIHALLGRPIAIMGYPGHDNDRFPLPGVVANATFHSGVISRLTDFDLSATSTPAERQFVQHTALGWGGFSGSPIFLPSGRVAALHNSSRAAEYTKFKFVRAFSHGVRIDCLWELLVHHGLADMVGLTAEQRNVSVARYLSGPSEEEKKLRDAIARIAEARRLIDEGDYRRAGELANAVVKSMPNYADGYLTRIVNYIYYIDDTWETMPMEPFNEYYGYVLKDLEKLKELTPADPYLPLIMAVLLNRRGLADEDVEVLKKADELFALLRQEADNIPVAMVDGRWHAIVYCESALTKQALEADGDEILALANQGVERAPDWSVPYVYRSGFNSNLGREAEAKHDELTAAALDNGDPLPPPLPE